MEVIATARGYYGGKIREPGAKFTLSSGKAFSEHWMKTEGGEKPPKVESKPAPAPKVESKPAPAPKVGSKPDSAPKAYHTVHKGFGKWDVFGLDGEVVEGGDNLKKAEAHALVEELKAGEEGDQGGESPPDDDKPEEG